MDSSSLGVRRRDTTQPTAYDTVAASACARRRNDTTRCKHIDMPPIMRKCEVTHKTGTGSTLQRFE